MIAPPTVPGARHSIVVNGATISYLRGGAGAPLLFLHGAGGVESWLPWMDALAATHDLIVPDHPGWGRSDTPDWFDNIHDLAYFYEDFIDALGLSSVDLVGNSIGGWIACEMAVRSNAHLASMCLVDPAGLRVIGVPRFDIFLASPEANAHAIFHDPALAQARLAQPLEGELLDRYLKNRYASARVGWQPRLYDPHLAKWLHRIDVPTLVIWGEHDRIFPVAMLDEFLRLIPGARGAVIPNCGHLPHVECTAAFVAHVDAFLAGVRA
jgi:pimeloyl-ACP methyl ester carboxylesterase